MSRALTCFVAWLLCGTMLLMAAGKTAKPKPKPLTPATVVKVLTHLVDQYGRHSEAPSLYERDAYQSWLRQHPEKIATIRFDIQWKAKAKAAEGYVLRLEMRGSKMDITKMVTFEQKVTEPKLVSKWSRIELTPEQFKEFGEPVAWRVSIWDGAKMVHSQESFLW
ncbi:MAG: hypothetical protein ACO1QB_08030 [Verrucomicrobiales bacterium]